MSLDRIDPPELPRPVGLRARGRRNRAHRLPGRADGAGRGRPDRPRGRRRPVRAGAGQPADRPARGRRRARAAGRADHLPGRRRRLPRARRRDRRGLAAAGRLAVPGDGRRRRHPPLGPRRAGRAAGHRAAADRPGLIIAPRGGVSCVILGSGGAAHGQHQQRPSGHVLPRPAAAAGAVAAAAVRAARAALPRPAERGPGAADRPARRPAVRARLGGGLELRRAAGAGAPGGRGAGRGPRPGPGQPGAAARAERAVAGRLLARGAAGRRRRGGHHADAAPGRAGPDRRALPTQPGPLPPRPRRRAAGPADRVLRRRRRADRALRGPRAAAPRGGHRGRRRRPARLHLRHHRPSEGDHAPAPRRAGHRRHVRPAPGPDLPRRRGHRHAADRVHVRAGRAGGVPAAGRARARCCWTG